MSDLLDLLGRLWQEATTAQPVPGTRTAIATALGAVAILLFRPFYRWVRLGLTVVHEAGHAAVAVLVGRRLAGIRLHSDTSGVTLSRGRPRGPGMVAMLAAGYAAPGVLGLAAAALTAAGYALGLLWLLVLLCLVLVVWARNGYALLVVLVIGVGLALFGWYAPEPAHWPAAAVLTWLLLLAAPRPLWELLRAGRRGRHGSDPDQLARITPLPAVLWIWLLLAVTVAGLVLGATTLLPSLW